MEVTLAVADLGASEVANHRTNITGVFTNVNPPVMPCRMREFCLVVFFEASPAEVGRPKDTLDRVIQPATKPYTAS